MVMNYLFKRDNKLQGIELIGNAPLFCFCSLFRFTMKRNSAFPLTNKSFGQWGELMGENAIATATLDRLLHHS